jgi:hypothetical protein
MRKAGRTPLHRELVETRIAELKSRIAVGGVNEGIIRALIYVGMPRAAIDERGFEAIRRMRQIHGGAQRPTLAEFKAMMRDQAFLVLLDPVSAVAALPALIPDVASRRWTVAAVRQVLSAGGEMNGEVAERLQHVASLLRVETDETAIASVSEAA